MKNPRKLPGMAAMILGLILASGSPLLAQSSDIWSLSHNASPATTIRIPSQSGSGLRAQYVSLADIINGLVSTTDPRLPSFNVKSAPYNAVGDGLSNDTAAFASALSDVCASGLGGVIYFPAGTYRLAPGFQVACKGVSIAGDGPSATLLKWTTDGDGIRFGTASPFTGACGGIHDLSIIGPTTRTGFSIVVDGCDNGSIENVKLNVGGNGIGFCTSGGTDCNLWWVGPGVDIIDYGTAAIGMELDAGNDRFVDGLSVRGADNDRTGKIGLYVKGSLGDWFYGDSDIVLQDTGVLISPSAGGVNWVHMTAVKADTNLTYGWHLTGSNPIRGFACTACWAGTNGNPWTGLGGSTSARGILLDNTSTATAVNFADVQVLDSGGTGVEIVSGFPNVSFVGGWVQGSSKQSSGTLPGIKVSNGGTIIDSLRSGNTEGTGSGTQSYGIEIGAGATNFKVSNNDVRHNNNAAGILNSAGLSATQIVTANLGSTAADSYLSTQSQGTTTTVWHGNASGAGSFGAVALGTDTSGTYVSSVAGTTNQIAVSGASGAVTFSLPKPLILSSNAAALPTPTSGTLAQFGQADGVTTRLQLFATAGNGSFDCMRADNTAATPNALASGVTICQFSAFGYGATGYSAGGRAQIQLNTAEAWSDTAQGTSLALRTTPKGSTTIRTVLTIDSEAHITPGGSAPTVACTGTGTSPTAPSMDGGSTDTGFTIIMPTGTGSPANTGTCTVTFNKGFTATANNPDIVCTLQAGATAWGIGSGIEITTKSQTAPVLTWWAETSGVLTGLAVSTSYQINCVVTGK